MNTEQIRASLDTMLENPKSKNFLNHMIKSYFPINKVEKVWEKPKGDFKCALSREPLVSISEIFEVTQSEDFKKDMLESLKSQVNGTVSESPFIKHLNGQKLGFTGKNTTTFLSPDSFQVFYDWVITKFLKGDKHINWLLNGIRRDEFIERGKVIGAVDSKVKPHSKSIEPHRTASFKLGDAYSALADLKAKMEKQGM